MTGTLDTPATRARLDDAWQRSPAHFRPVIAAVRDCGIGLLFVQQGACSFRIPEATKRPGVYVIADDLDQAMGPQGFHQPSLRRAIRGCVAFTVVAGAATPEVYAAMAAIAVGGGLAMIVETQPTQEILWVELIQKLAPKRPLIWSTVKAGRA
jgi:hypothetical protein